MNRMLSTIALGLVVASGACSRSNNHAADTALNTDLSLAAQQRNSLALDSAERANALAAQAPVPQHAAAGEVAHTHHYAHRSAEATTTTTTTSSGGTVVKHTQRDAAIGAAAGAILGATTSRNKVKGGVIGAAVGGLLGGVLGNNVDKTKKKP